ncbi:MAG: hypothetical protein QM714_13325 [Nocardioides sp.]
MTDFRERDHQGRDASIRFVGWDPKTGDLQLVTRTRALLPGFSVAADLLG